MHIPLYSTVTLFAELIVSTIIYYSLYQGYKNNKFPVKLAAAALTYEILFNISYMASRVPATAKSAPLDSPFLIGLAITHGILSLVMFISLVVFFAFAFRSYRKGVNYFKAHKFLTTIFLIFWTISIVSGVSLYIFEYLL